MSDEMTIWKYIPKRLEDAIDDVEYRGFVEEGDAKYWVYLKDGWVAYDGGNDCKTILAVTIKELKEAIKTIRRMEA